jgi:hypothetical protein
MRIGLKEGREEGIMGWLVGWLVRNGRMGGLMREWKDGGWSLVGSLRFLYTHIFIYLSIYPSHPITHHNFRYELLQP